MATRQYQIPGVGTVNVEEDAREYQLPEGGILTSQASAPAATSGGFLTLLGVG